MKNSIKNLSFEELQDWAVMKGLKPFTGRQIFEWIFAKSVFETAEMKNIAKTTRSLIDEAGPLALLRPDKHEVSADDSSEKFLFTCLDGQSLESVLLISGSRHTACVSSEVGCAMGCTFCRTGEMGLIRKLSSGEIVEQVQRIQQLSGKMISNVVFMGMGEPFSNYDEVIKAALILNHEKGLRIGARRITISTSGIVPRMLDFARLPYQFKLAVSLNAATNGKRDTLMPVNRSYPLEALFDAARAYTEITGKHITFEYVLIKGVNDSAEDARALTKALRTIPSKLNIIPYNETDGPYKRPDEKDIRNFISHFEEVPFAVTLRYSGGRGIRAACGQLYHEARRS